MLFNEVNYTADISYLTNVFIYEYDISKANINILYTKKVIDKNTYEYLYNSERMVRQVYIGKLCKDKNISDILKSGIIEAKKMLFEANDIQDNDVLSIKNDAVFIINKILQNTKFDLINFIQKNVYTSFYKLNGMEFYYYFNNITKEERIDIKGISNSKIKYHENYFLQIIKDLFYSLQVNGVEITMRMLKDIYNDYITLKLPIQCYRNFDINSDYHLNFTSFLNTGYCIENATENQKNIINITKNLSILVEFQRILSSIYFNKYR